MAKLTIALGILLILVGIVGFVYTGSAHPTALIPAIFGLAFVLFGIMANTENAKKRMLWMHVSVTVALLGFLGTIKADIDTVRLSRGVEFPHPAAILEKGAMSLLCLIYVLFCVRSFIAARRARLG
jgi:hypothetical protein